MFREWKQAVVAVVGLITLTFAVAGSVGAAEEGVPDATVEFSSGSAGIIAGVQWGKGTLRYKGRDYPIEFRGVSAGDVGVKGTWGTGEVYHLSKLEDFPGNYDSVSLGVTLGGGGAAAALRNQKGVIIQVRGATLGAQVNLSIQGVEVMLADKK